MTTATWQDVATALGRPASDLTTAEQEQLSWWLEGAELLIASRLGPLAALDQNALKYVEAEAVAEKKRGTEARVGESSVTVAVDDGSVTKRYEKTPVLDSDISDDWWDMLRGQRRPRAKSMRVGGGYLLR